MYEDDENEVNESSENQHGRLKPGRFRARAIEAGLGDSSEGNPQVAVAFQILDEGYESCVINWYGSFSKKLGNGTKTPFQRTIESLRVCGWQGDDLSDLSGIDANEVSLVLDIEEFNGKRQLKVKWVNRPGGLALKAPMTDEKKKAFAAKMKGEVMAASRNIPAASKPSGAPPKSNGGGYSRSAPPRQDAPPPGDDDIPFDV